MGKEPPESGRKSVGRRGFLVAVLVCGGLLALGIVLGWRLGAGDWKWWSEASVSLEDIPKDRFDGTRAYGYLEQICAIGRRPSGSPGMLEQQQLLEDHFRGRGGEIHWQRFQAPHPEDGTPVPMANLIVQWHPERSRRVLLCAHYDTLPYPMLDPDDPRGTFVGANDGASGVAVLMELAHHVPDLLERQTDFGVDFALFDGEEFVFSRADKYFWGSEWFARQYAEGEFPYIGRYRWGVLLDMIGDAELQIYQECNSMFWEDTRPLVEQIWATARRLGVTEFVPEEKHEVRDDHVSLHNIGGIPACNLIDFDYPPWHTQGDTPDKCSAASLAKVGWVIREWLENVRDDEPAGGVIGRIPDNRAVGDE